VKFRLPHILALMGLILAAGVLSVRHLEHDVGASTVPGVVVVEVPGLDARVADALAARVPGGRPEWVPAAPGVLQPFGVELAGRRAREGAATLLVSAPALADPGAERRGWRVVIERPGQPPELPAAGRALRVVEDFVRQQGGVRAFLVALDPGPLAGDLPRELAALLEPLLSAADALPRIRRTSVVLLGERDATGERRLALRFDRGRWGLRSAPALDDLLQEAW